MAREIRYAEAGFFELDDGTEIDARNKLSLLVVPEIVVRDVALSSLRRALSNADWLESNALFVAAVAAEDLDDRYPQLRDDLWLQPADERGMDVCITVPESFWDEDDAPWRSRVPKLLEPLVARYSGRNLRLEENEHFEGVTAAKFTVSTRAKTVGDALGIAEEAAALIAAAEGGQLALKPTVDLVRTGHVSALVGTEEGPWLDGKAAPYRLEEESQKWELAKDVAAFANSTTGGLIVIGARTRRTRDGDTIVGISELPLDLVEVQRYRALLSARIHPPIHGLEVRTVELTVGRGVALIHVPVQQEGRKPFLVRGTRDSGGATAVFMAVPERDGHSTRYVDVAEIHGLLLAGRARLRS